MISLSTMLGEKAMTTIYHNYLQYVIVTKYMKKLNISIDLSNNIIIYIIKTKISIIKKIIHPYLQNIGLIKKIILNLQNRDDSKMWWKKNLLLDTSGTS